MPQSVEKKKPQRDEYGKVRADVNIDMCIGKVITEKRNIFTTVTHPGYGASTIGHLFSKPDEFIPDPYERRKELERVRKFM